MAERLEIIGPLGDPAPTSDGEFQFHIKLNRWPEDHEASRLTKGVKPFHAVVPPPEANSAPRVTVTAPKPQVGVAVERLKSAVNALTNASLPGGVSESEEVADEIRKALDGD